MILYTCRYSRDPMILSARVNIRERFALQPGPTAGYSCGRIRRGTALQTTERCIMTAAMTSTSWPQPSRHQHHWLRDTNMTFRARRESLPHPQRSFRSGASPKPPNGGHEGSNVFPCVAVFFLSIIAPCLSQVPNCGAQRTTITSATMLVSRSNECGLFTRWTRSGDFLRVGVI